jgi:GT2 family glycosyltransferase
MSAALTIDIVCATRHSKADFLTKSALGRSFARIAWNKRFRFFVELNNTAPLPVVYNKAIDATASDAILIFVHDDIWLDDCFLSNRLDDALTRFDVIGIAGNRRIAPMHTGWAFIDDALTWDESNNLSGGVAHGALSGGEMSYFGESPAECELLDGVFLSARRSVLKDANTRFDPTFAFHFYDLDFCRTARKATLTLGTWPIAITHQSGGKFGTPEWRHALANYRKKWSL